MEAYENTPIGFVDVVTILTIVGTLATSLRIVLNRDSAGIAFWPIALAALCSYSWLIYGCAIGDGTVKFMSWLSVVLMGVNAVVHRVFVKDTGPGFEVRATLCVMCTMSVAAPPMNVASLGLLATFWGLLCAVAPAFRIIQADPLPEMAFWTVTSCGLWLDKAMRADNDPLSICYVGGIVIATAELVFYCWLEFWGGARVLKRNASIRIGQGKHDWRIVTSG
ncbi:hypothetical protein HPB50_012371 [Hyalomma asiaticum]|uniref:Uncharacterized protein n=1 Tax=Hyalomma asiaticum TaxID=266040 RepID=A0ACB7TH29_HYAAI|nr:hypothetical protein HPB50_012371 [Hyalomma asiaticum]